MMPNNARLGIALMILTSLVFALQDGIARYLASQYNVITIVALRFWFFAALTVCLSTVRSGGIGKVVKSAQPWTQVARAVFLVANISLMIASFVRLGLIATHAIFAVCPLLVAALAGPLLGEHVGWRRWLAILVGMIGMLVILRPGFQVFSPAAVLPLAAALLLALYVLLTRKVSRTDSAETTFFYTGTVGAAAITVIVPFFWTPIHDVMDWAWMALLCVMAAFGHFLLIKTYEVAEVGVIQPFAYSQLLFVGLLGIMFFNERPDPWTLMGAALIVAAGVHAALNESRTVGMGKARPASGKASL